MPDSGAVVTPNPYRSNATMAISKFLAGGVAPAAIFCRFALIRRAFAMHALHSPESLEKHLQCNDKPRPNTMIKPTFSSLFAKRFGAGWTCARCRTQGPRPILPRAPLSRRYGTTGPSSSSQPRPKPRRRAAVLLATAGGGATAMLLSVGDDVKSSYEAIERSGRVVSTLVLCVNE